MTIKAFSSAALLLLAALPIRPASALDTVRFDELKPAPVKLEVKDARRSGQDKTHNSGIAGSMVQRHFGDSQFSVKPIEVFRNRLAIALGERLQGVPIAITELRITTEAKAPQGTGPNPNVAVPAPAGASPMQSALGEAIGMGIVGAINEATLTRLAEEEPYRVYCVIYGNVGRWPFSGSASKPDPDPKQLQVEMKAVVERAIANAIGDLEKRLVLLQQQAPAVPPTASPAHPPKVQQERETSGERGRGRGRYRSSGDVPLESRSGN